jgi:hypothetical protein
LVMTSIRPATGTALGACQGNVGMPLGTNKGGGGNMKGG